jgi:twitching motility protein PilT
MAGVDSLLGIVIQQGADELRLGTDITPRMLQMGTPKRLALPATPDDTLRQLLGPLLTPERETELWSQGRLELVHKTPDGSNFFVLITARKGAGAAAGAFDVVFVRGVRRPGPSRDSSASMPAAVAAVTAPPVPVRSDPPPTVAAPRASMLPQADTTLASLLARAVGLRASDLHLADASSPTVRIDGSLRPLSDEGPVDVRELFGPLFDEAAKARIEAGASADLAIDVADVGRFRANLFRARTGLAAAIRVLPRSPPRLLDLGLPIPLDDLVDLPHGLVVVCGPTGSGKSTTLAALGGEALRRRSAVVISLEDPIEYVLEPPNPTSLVRQRQIGRDARDFASGLRDALREDPDILLIGEMRDPESISLALTAAETGHLVLTTLHSRSAASAIERIVDAYPPERQSQVRVQLADALRAVIAIRLLPRASGSGRVPALEVLRGNHAVAGLVREGRTAQLTTVMQSARREGMIPLERCLADLVKAGQVSRSVATAAANDPGALGQYLGT